MCHISDLETLPCHPDRNLVPDYLGQRSGPQAIVGTIFLFAMNNDLMIIMPAKLVKLGTI